MSDKITVYKIYKGKIVSVQAKETAIMVTFDSYEPAFGFQKRVLKALVAFTPQEAIQERRNSLLSTIGMLEDKLKLKTVELKNLNEMVHI